MKAKLWRIHRNYSKWKVKTEMPSSIFLFSIYRLQKQVGGGGFMIAPPPLGYRREVSPLMNRVWWLNSPDSSNQKKWKWLDLEWYSNRSQKAAVVHLARPEQSPLNQSSHHHVQYQKLQKLVRMWKSAPLAPSHLARPDKCFWTGRATLARANSGRVGFFWLILVAWLMMFHFFEPSTFRWAVYATKRISLCSILMITCWNEIKHQSNKTSVKSNKTMQ